MIGKKIKEKRSRRGITQEKFAEMIGCSQSNVSKYENDELGIDAMMLLKIANVLGCTVDDFFHETKIEQEGVTIEPINKIRERYGLKPLPCDEANQVLKKFD